MIFQTRNGMINVTSKPEPGKLDQPERQHSTTNETYTVNKSLSGYSPRKMQNREKIKKQP